MNRTCKLLFMQFSMAKLIACKNLASAGTLGDLVQGRRACRQYENKKIIINLSAKELGALHFTRTI